MAIIGLRRPRASSPARQFTDSSCSDWAEQLRATQPSMPASSATLLRSCRIQRGISGGPPGNNSPELDLSWQDEHGNGWMVGIIPAYGAADLAPWYEIQRGQASMSQTSLATSKPDGLIHLLAQSPGHVFTGTEDPPFRLTELEPRGTPLRFGADSGALAPRSGPPLEYRVVEYVYPGDPGLVYATIEVANPSTIAVPLAESGSLDLTLLAGLVQVRQGSAKTAWTATNGRWARLGEDEQIWPEELTPADPDYAYITPAQAAGLTLVPFVVKKLGMQEAIPGFQSAHLQYARNRTRLKLKLEGRLGSFPPSTSCTLQYLQGFRRVTGADDIRSIAADYRMPDGSDAFSVGSFLTYSHTEGMYVVTASGDRVAVTHSMPPPVTKRWLPKYKILGYTSRDQPRVMLGGAELVHGHDYLCHIDTGSHTLYCVMLKSLVPGPPRAGELRSSMLEIGPAGER